MKKILRNLEIFILAVGIVFVWRGVWGLTDIFLFPENLLLSKSVSLLIGLIILYLHNMNLKELLKVED